MKYLLAIIILIFSVGAVQPQTLYQTLYPPRKYDFPFPGPTVITRMGNPQELRQLCLSKDYVAACARAISYTCQIWILTDEWLKRIGKNYDRVLRHEIGHCNGWPGDHAGGRLTEQPTIGDGIGAPEIAVQYSNPPFRLDPLQLYEGQPLEQQLLELGLRRLKEMKKGQ